MKVDKGSESSSQSRSELEVRVLFSETGQIRSFGFDQKGITIGQLKEVIGKNSSPSLASSSSSLSLNTRFFLDKSGREPDDGQILDNGAELIVFSPDARLQPVQQVDSRPLQVPALSSVPPLMLPTLKLDTPASQQLHEYLQIFHALGAQLDSIRSAASDRYSKLEQLFVLINGLVEALRCLFLRLGSANEELGSGMQELQKQLSQLDQLVSQSEEDVVKLRDTKLHPVHMLTEPQRETLLDVLPPFDLATFRKNVESIRSKIQRLSADHKLKVNLDEPRISQAGQQLSSLKKEFHHKRSLLHDLDAATATHKNLIQQIISALSKDNPMIHSDTLKVCARPGTVNDLRSRQPQFITSAIASYEAIEATHQQCLQLCSVLKSIIADRIETLSAIKVLDLSKATHAGNIQSAQARFRQIHFLPDSYEAALREVQRRQDFDGKLASYVARVNNQIQSICDQEVASRAKFASNHLEFLDPQLFPGIEDSPAFSSAEISHFDEKLPKILRVDQSEQQQQPSAINEEELLPAFDSPPRTTENTVLSSQKQMEELQLKVADQEQHIAELNIFINQNYIDQENVKRQFDGEVERLSSDILEKTKAYSLLEDRLKTAEQLNLRLIKDEADNSVERSELQKFKQNYEQLGRELAAANEALSTARQTLSQVETDRAAKNEQLNALTSQITSLRASSIRNTLPNFGNERGPLEQDQIVEYICELSAGIESLNMQLQSVSAERDCRTAERNSLAIEVTELQSGKITAEQELSQIKEELARVKKALVDGTASLNVDSLTRERDQLRIQLANLKTSVERDPVDRTQTLEELRQVKQALQRAQNECSEKDRLLRGSENKVRTLEQTLRITEQSKSLADMENSSLKAELELAHKETEQALRRKTDSLASKQEMESLRKELAESQSNLARSRDELTAVSKQLEQTRKQVTQLTQSGDQFAKDLSSTKQRLDEAKARIQELEQSGVQTETETEKLKRKLVDVIADRNAKQEQLTRAMAETEALRKAVADHIAKQEQLTRAMAETEALRKEATQQLKEAVADRNNKQEQLHRCATEVEALRRDHSSKAQQLNAALAAQNRYAAEIEALRTELVSRNPMPHETRQSSELMEISLVQCADGLAAVASILGVHELANSIQDVMQDPRSSVVNPQAVQAIIEKLVQFVESRSPAVPQQADNQQQSKTMIKVSDFTQGDKILFLPVPGSRAPAEQEFYALCQDPSEPLSFLSQETLSLMHNDIRQSSFLIGEFVFADSNVATPNNPYNLHTGTRYNVIHARF